MIDGDGSRTSRICLFILLGILIFTGFVLRIIPVFAYVINWSGNHYLPLVFNQWSLNTPTPQPGLLLISEVVYDSAGKEPDGEWIEVFNAGGQSLDLGAYIIGDEETLGEQEGMYQFPEGGVIEPGQVVIIACRAIVFSQKYDFSPDYEFKESDPNVPNMVKYPAWAGGNVELENTGDEVILMDSAYDWVDSVSWGSSIVALNPSVSKTNEDHSIERYPADEDSDSADDWRSQASPQPGQVDVTTPTSTATTTPSMTQTMPDTPTETASPTPLDTATLTSTETPLLTNTPTHPTPSPSDTGTETSIPATVTPPATNTPSGQMDLLISEVLYDSNEIADPGGEWMEIYNAGDVTVSLADFKIGDEEQQGGGEGMLQFPSGAEIVSQGVIVIANNALDFQSIYAQDPDYEIVNSSESVPDMINYAEWAGGSVYLNNSGDTVLLLDVVDAVVDAVSWGSSTFAFEPSVSLIEEGHSLERFPPDEDSDCAEDWRDQSLPGPGEIDLSTPPTLPATIAPTIPSTTTPIAKLVINEINADPDSSLGDANGDGEVNVYDDEFVEIVNDSGEEINVSGWTLKDSIGVKHTFPEGTVIPNDCSVVVFAGGYPQGIFGGSVVQLASMGGLGLNNGGDSVILADKEGTTAVSYTYGTEGGDNQSLTRVPDITGENPLVKHSTAEGSAGTLFSPGTKIDGDNFNGCPTNNVTASPNSMFPLTILNWLFWR